MGYNDYTKFGRHNKFKNENNKQEDKEEVIEENSNTTVEEILEENNIEFEELSKEEVDDLKEDEIIDVNLNNTSDFNLANSFDNLYLGQVYNCEKLNVRKQANKDSEVVEIIQKDDIVNVYLNESTDDFYRVFTKSNSFGYCMKKFIKIY